MSHQYFSREKFLNSDIIELFSHHSIKPLDSKLFTHKSIHDGICIVYHSQPLNKNDFFNHAILGYFEYMIDTNHIKITKLCFKSQFAIIQSIINLINDILIHFNDMYISFCDSIRKDRNLQFLLCIINLKNNNTLINTSFTPYTHCIEFIKPNTSNKETQTIQVAQTVTPKQTTSSITPQFGAKSTSFNTPQTTQPAQFAAKTTSFNTPQTTQPAQFGTKTTSFNTPQTTKPAQFGAKTTSFNTPQTTQPAQFGAKTTSFNTQQACRPKTSMNSFGANSGGFGSFNNLTGQKKQKTNSSFSFGFNQ